MLLMIFPCTYQSSEFNRRNLSIATSKVTRTFKKNTTNNNNNLLTKVRLFINIILKRIIKKFTTKMLNVAREMDIVEQNSLNQE